MNVLYVIFVSVWDWDAPLNKISISFFSLGHQDHWIGIDPGFPVTHMLEVWPNEPGDRYAYE